MKIGNHNIERAEILSEPDWLLRRKEFIGSSDAAALFGEGYANKPNVWSVWADKMGKLPADGKVDDDERVMWGRLLEQPILEMVCRRTGWSQLRPVSSVGGGWEDPPKDTRLLIPTPMPAYRLAATCDDFVYDHDDGLGLIEIKNRDWLTWRDTYTDDDAAARDQIQLAHQMICVPEAKWGVIAVLVGGNDLKLYHYTREDMAQRIEDILDRVEQLQAQLDHDIEPPLLDEREMPSWAQLHRDDPVSEGPIQIEDVDKFDAACRVYAESSDLAKEHKKAADKAKAYIVSVAEKNEAAQSTGWFAKLTYTPTKENAVELPQEVRSTLDQLYAGLDDQHLHSALKEAVDFRHVVRKASMSTKLKVEPLATAQHLPGEGDHDIVEEIGKARIGA